MKAKKHFGQHFLNDPKTLDCIVNAISPCKSDNFLEIGPGRGALTKLLLPLVQNFSAVEVDYDCVNYLKDWQGLNLYHDDILKFNWSDVKQNTRVVGNLPYNIATEIFFICFEKSDLVKDMHFMMQREVALRLVATPGTKAYGRLSVMAQIRSDINKLFDIAPTCFTPAPKVISSFCLLKPKQHQLQNTLISLIDKIVTKAFSQRRKQCHHTLKHWFSKQDLLLLGVDPTWRPENISVELYIKLANSLID